MITKENAQKLVSYMPKTMLVSEVIRIFRELEKMEATQNPGEIDWNSLKEDIDAWPEVSAKTV
jgi:hypothetical protein